MNAAHLHLLINHLPVIGVPVALALLAVAALRRSEELTRVAYGFFIALGLATIAVYLSGEPAEDVLTAAATVAESAIEAHEEAALIAFVGVGLLAVLAAFGLIAARKPPPPAWIRPLVMIVAIVVAGLLAWTANRGGSIRHTEIGRVAYLGANSGRFGQESSSWAGALYGNVWLGNRTRPASFGSVRVR